jgi:hypothetical protein
MRAPAYAGIANVEAARMGRFHDFSSASAALWRLDLRKLARPIPVRKDHLMFNIRSLPAARLERSNAPVASPAGHGSSRFPVTRLRYDADHAQRS